MEHRGIDSKGKCICSLSPDHPDPIDRNAKAYKPQMVSIGPLHSKDLEAANNETLKNVLLRHTLPYRAKSILRSQMSCFKDLVDGMIDGHLISRIREWYLIDKEYADKDEDLCLMIARDGLFLLQYLREVSRSSKESSFSLSQDYDAARFFRAFILQSGIQEDIMKLENQIPIFALDMIHKWELDTRTKMVGDYEKSTKPILQDLILHLEADADRDPISTLKCAWHNLSPFQYKCDRQNSVVSADSHLLGFVYENIICSSESDSKDHPECNAISREKRDIDDLCSAANLKSRGVQFAAQQEDQFLDKIRFDSTTCTYYLPPILMDDRAEAVIRNLVEFEEIVSEKKSKPLMRYVYLMHRLIREASDVEVLRKGGIILNHLRTDGDVVKLWKGMEYIKLREGAYEPIDKSVAEVLRFYESKYRIFMLRIMFRVIFGDFKQRYFSNPWIAASFIAACVLFVITIMQTVLLWVQVRIMS